MSALSSSFVGTATIEITGLRYVRDRQILKGIDWRVEPGEHWVILGPNGCGKTSLINCLTGYEMATAGDIYVDGAEYGRTDWREVRKRVGLVTSTLTFYLEPGEPVLDAVVSGREAMINLVGEVDPALRQEARDLLNRIGCGYLADSRWGVLSQGERQKILICRALMAVQVVFVQFGAQIDLQQLPDETALLFGQSPELLLLQALFVRSDGLPERR